MPLSQEALRQVKATFVTYQVRLDESTCAPETVKGAVRQ